MIFPCPKPEKGPKAPRKRVERERGSDDARLNRLLDAACGQLVKELALKRCENCGRFGTDQNPLTWAHGDGRAQVWALRWAHSNTFCLCWECHRVYEKDPEAFLAFRRNQVSDLAWAQVEELERSRPIVGVEEKKLIYADLKRGVFRQGAR